MALGLVFRVGVGSLVTRGYLRVFSAAVVMVGMMARIGSDIVGSWHYLKNASPRRRGIYPEKSKT